MSDSEVQARNGKLLRDPANKPCFARCSFHKINWQPICRVAVAAVQSYADEAAALKWALQQLGGPCEQHELRALLSEVPIRWVDGDSRLGNGQHRVCAMKEQHVPWTVVAR